MSFPKYGHAVFAWVALVPLLISLREVRAGEGLRLGFLTGLLYYVGVIYWISYVVENYGSAPAFAGYGAMLLLSAFLALFVAAVAAAVAYFRDRGIPAILSAPVLWTCMEYAKSHVLTGFPWENLAYSQHSFLSIIQIGDVTGFYGITFLIVFVNVVIADLISLRNDRSNKKRVWIELSAAAFLFVSTCAYGVYRIGTRGRIGAENQNRACCADPGQHRPEHQMGALFSGRITQDLSGPDPEDLSRRQILRRALVIWPETATPFYFQDMDDRHREILRLARESRTWLLFGSPSYIPERGTDYSRNSAFMISPEGSIAGAMTRCTWSRSANMCPFGSIFPFMSRLVAGVGDFLTGSGFTTLKTDHHRIGVLICYEAIFPEISRAYVQGGADLLVNITNDAWFGRTSAPYQHLSMTAFRAVESGRYIVRAANTGISAIIDPVGRISNQTDLYRKSGLAGSVRYLQIDSIYVRIGDVFAYACLAGLGIMLISTIRRKRHVRRTERKNFKSGKPRRKIAELSLK